MQKREKGKSQVRLLQAKSKSFTSEDLTDMNISMNSARSSQYDTLSVAPKLKALAGAELSDSQTYLFVTRKYWRSVVTVRGEDALRWGGAFL